MKTTADDAAHDKIMEEQVAELQKTNADLQEQLASCQQLSKAPKKKMAKKVPDQ